MKTLTILRHAKSNWKQNGASDRQRGLSPRGERDAPVMGSRIVEAGIRPSLIMSSPAARAWKTAKMIARAISYPVEFLHREESLYMADSDQLLDLLAQQDNAFNSIMIVGHNPGLTELANRLVPEITDNLPTCGLVAFNVETSDWDLRSGATVDLLLYDYPKNKS